MDGNGMPLAFNINSGNTNEQVTMTPLEEKIIKDFELSGVGCISNSNDNIYSAVVIPSYKMIIVEKDKHYNY